MDTAVPVTVQFGWAAEAYLFRHTNAAWIMAKIFIICVVLALDVAHVAQLLTL
jgi:hypothetical protein